MPRPTGRNSYVTQHLRVQHVVLGIAHENPIRCAVRSALLTERIVTYGSFKRSLYLSQRTFFAKKGQTFGKIWKGEIDRRIRLRWVESVVYTTNSTEGCGRKTGGADHSERQTACKGGYYESVNEMESLPRARGYPKPAKFFVWSNALAWFWGGGHDGQRMDAIGGHR
jgi:hypothetical protein